MGQADVLSFLKENENKWFLAKELMDELGVGRGSIVRILKRLIETNYVKSELANKVIFNKNRLKKTTKLALAYSINKD